MRKLLKSILPALMGVAMTGLGSCSEGNTTVAPKAMVGSGAATASDQQINDARVLLAGESLPLCQSGIYGRVYFIMEAKSFKFCADDQWKNLDMKGEQGIAGVKGDTGEKGETGATGARGEQGLAGAKGDTGLSPLIAVSSEPSGSNCANGGQVINVGLDGNRNSILDADEVKMTTYQCSLIACTPGSAVGNSDCKSDIANSENATKSKTCNSAGGSVVFGKCTASACKSGYYLDQNVCSPQRCEPNKVNSVDCKAEKTNSAVAVKTQTCKQNGSDYTYGACNVTGCASGYYLKDGSCVAQACKPSQSYGSVNCMSDIPSSAAASKSKTCNSLGSDYIYGNCGVTSCAAGYYMSGNSCVAQKCKPNVTTPNVDCKSQALFASVATLTRTCKSVGDNYVDGPCEVSSCSSGYYLSGKSCVAQKCSPNQKLPALSCVSELPNSLTAEKSNSCNSEGSGYLYGSCQALTCAAGYELFEGACREDKRVESVLTLLTEFKPPVPVTTDVCLKANIVGDTPGNASCKQLPRMLQINRMPFTVTIKAKSGACNVLSLEFRQQFVDGRESSISTSKLKGVQVSKRGPNSFEIVDYNDVSPWVLWIKGDGKANFTLENSNFECDDSAGSSLPKVPNHEVAEPSVDTVIDNDGLTLSDCATEKAVEDPNATFSKKLQLRAGDDIAPFINSFSAYTRVKVGAMYFDANTANFVCQLHGFVGGVATERGSFNSPTGNNIYRWEPKTKQLQGDNAAAVGNSTIRAYTCRGKLIDICKKDPSWIFQQLP